MKRKAFKSNFDKNKRQKKAHFRDEEIESDSDFDEEETLFNSTEVSAAALTRNEKALAQMERRVPKIEKVSDVKDDGLSIDEKRIQIAKNYLSKVKEFEEEQHYEQESMMRSSSKDPIAERLKKEALRDQKRVPTSLARHVAAADESKCTKVFFRGHKKPPTCVSVTRDFTEALTGSKDCCLIHWDLATGKKKSVIRGHRSKETKGHTAEILACAICPRESYLAASGGRDNVIKLWDLRTDNKAPIGQLTGHFGAITSLCFQLGTTNLFSGSLDRTVKVWDVAERSFVETLYGHEAEVLGVDALHSYRVLSSAADHSIRLWKVEEETQLLFKSHNLPIDCVKMLRENIYLSAGQGGNIHVFNRSKRRPMHTYTHTGASVDKTYGKNLGWVSSLGTVQYSDLFTAGSDYGQIDFYGMNSGFIRRISLPAEVRGNKIENEFQGWINGMEMDYSKVDAELKIVGVCGSEHRMGRWGSKTGIRNGLFVVKWDLLGDNATNGALDHVSEEEDEDGEE